MLAILAAHGLDNYFAARRHKVHVSLSVFSTFALADQPFWYAGCIQQHENHCHAIAGNSWISPSPGPGGTVGCHSGIFYRAITLERSIHSGAPHNDSLQAT
jgi:hypothetical protein